MVDKIKQSDTDAQAAKRNAASVGAPRGLGSATDKQGKEMIGAEAVIASLEAEGVDTVFGYPGGQAIKMYDALYDSEQASPVWSSSPVDRARPIRSQVSQRRIWTRFQWLLSQDRCRVQLLVRIRSKNPTSSESRCQS